MGALVGTRLTGGASDLHGPGMPALPPGHLIMRDLLAEAVGMETAQIEERFGASFFVLQTTEMELKMGADGPGGSTLDTLFVAIPVRKREGATGVMLDVTIGRTHNNDVVIPHASVSGFHAFVRRDDDGRLRLVDAGSRNGTFVGKRRAAEKGQGDDEVLTPLCPVRFGSVTATWVPASELAKFSTALRL